MDIIRVKKVSKEVFFNVFLVIEVQFKDANFSYASFVRGQRDWMSCCWDEPVCDVTAFAADGGSKGLIYELDEENRDSNGVEYVNKDEDAGTIQFVVPIAFEGNAGKVVVPQQVKIVSG